MADPTITPRGLPLAIRLDDGYQSVIVFENNDTLAIFEKSVQPPAMDGGDPIDTTTMLNSEWETKAPQRLKMLDDSTIIGAYSPTALADFEALINVPQSVTWAWPDGSAMAAWAYLKRFEPGPMVKGEQPEATLTIVVTNWDPVNCVEAGPVYYEGTGSC